MDNEEFSQCLAEEKALASADCFSDWLIGECAGNVADSLPDQIRGERTAEDFAETPVADLYRLAIDLGQRSQVRCAAMDAIRERYLKANKTRIDSDAIDLFSEMEPL